MTNVKALEICTAQTFCGIGILLSIISLLLHIGRPCFERILSRLSLRVAADLWWLAYVVLRDGTLFCAMVIGLWHLNLNLMADIKVGLPFVPFGTVALACALASKVFRNAEDLNGSHRWVTLCVLAGALLNTLGYALVMEASDGEYPAANTPFWQTMVSWRSNKNPEFATVVFYITGILLAALATFAVVKSIRLQAHAAARSNEQCTAFDSSQENARFIYRGNSAGVFGPQERGIGTHGWRGVC